MIRAATISRATMEMATNTRAAPCSSRSLIRRVEYEVTISPLSWPADDEHRRGATDGLRVVAEDAADEGEERSVPRHLDTDPVEAVFDVGAAGVRRAAGR